MQADGWPERIGTEPYPPLRLPRHARTALQASRWWLLSQTYAWKRPQPRDGQRQDLCKITQKPTHAARKVLLTAHTNATTQPKNPHGESQAKTIHTQHSPKLQLSEFNVNCSRSHSLHVAQHASGEGGKKAAWRGR